MENSDYLGQIEFPSPLGGFYLFQSLQKGLNFKYVNPSVDLLDFPLLGGGVLFLYDSLNPSFFISDNSSVALRVFQLCGEDEPVEAFRPNLLKTSPKGFGGYKGGIAV